ncbi:MAG: metallophosphoesterase family protein [Candidatus Electronema sp. VV]
MTRLLVLSDIHGNWPALLAVAAQADLSRVDQIINCGDTTVYAPFANQVLDWLADRRALSILGNTDSKVIKLLNGKEFKKPSSAEKRIMYTHTAETLIRRNKKRLLAMKKQGRLQLGTHRIAFFHGSPDEPSEFLFTSTPDQRFRELAASTEAEIIITGHSHEAYHKIIGGVHFLNPGSVGRMFDGNPAASYLILELGLGRKKIRAEFRRCAYDAELVAQGLAQAGLPEIYAAMFLQGLKLN